MAVEIEIDLITRQAQANADALEGSLKSLYIQKKALEIASKLATEAITALGAAISGSIQDAIKFEAKLAEISTLFQSGFDTDKARKDLLDLSSAFGLDQADVAKGYYDTISAGITDAADAAKVLEGAAKLATGGLTSQATAIEGLTNIIKGYALDVSKTAEITDTLFIGAQVGKTTIDELSKSIGQVSPLANAAGVSFQETVAAMSALTLSGKTTSEATTGLRGAIENLLRPNAEMTKSLEKAGITSVTASLQTDGLTGVFQKLVKATGGTTEGLAKVFGSVEGLQAVLSLAGPQAADYATALKQMGDAAQNAGSVTDGAVTKMKNTADFQLKALEASFRNLGTEVFSVLEPGIAKGAELLTTFIVNVKDFVRENEEAFKAIGKAFSQMIEDFADFAIAVKQSDLFKVAIEVLGEAALEIFKELKAAAAEISASFSEAFGSSSQDVNLFRAVFKGFIQYFVEEIKAVVTIVTFFATSIADLASVFNALKANATASFNGIRDAIVDNLVLAFKAVSDFISKVVSVFRTLDTITGKQMFSGITEGLASFNKDINDFSASIDRTKLAAKALTETHKKQAEESSAIMKKVREERSAMSAEEQSLAKQEESSRDYYAKREKVRAAEAIEAANKKLAEEKKAAEESKKTAEDAAKNKEKLLKEERDFTYAVFKDEQDAEAFNNEQLLKLETEVNKERLDSAKKAAEEEAKFRYDMFKDEQDAEAFNNEQLLKLQEDLIKEQKKKTEEWYSNTIGTIKGLASALSSITSAFNNTDPVLVQAELEKIPTDVQDPVAAIEEETKAKIAGIEEATKASQESLDNESASRKKVIEDEYAAKIEAYKRAQELVDAANKDDIASKKESLKAGLAALKQYYAEVDAKEKDAKVKRTAEETAAIKKQRQEEYDNFSAGNNLRNETLTATQQALAKQQREDIVKNMEIERDEKLKTLEVAYKKQKADNDKLLSDAKKTSDDKVAAEKKKVEQAKKQAKIDEVNAKNNAALAKAAAANAKAAAEADKKKLEAASKVAGAIGEQLSKIPGIVGMVGGLIAGIVSVVFQLPEIIRGLPNMIEGFLNAIPMLFEALGKAFGEAIGPLMQLAFKFFFSVDFWVEIISSFINALGDGIMGFVNGVGGMIAELFGSKIWDGIGNAFESAGNWLADVGSSIWAGMKGAGEAAGDWLASLGSQIWEGLKAMGSAIGDFFANAGKSIWAGFSALFETIWAWFKDIGARIWGGLTDAIGDVVETFGNWGRSIWDGFTTVVKDIAAWFAEKGAAIWNGFVNALKAIGDFFGDLGKSIWNGLWSGIKGLGEWLYNAGKNIWNGLLSVIDIGIFSGGGGVNPTPYQASGGTGGHQTPLLSRAPGGMIPGMARMAGDSPSNDTVLAMLSPGELVIPRSAVSRGLPGVMQFARDTLNSSGSPLLPRFASGGMSGGASAGMGFSLDGLVQEMQSLRSEVSSIGYALAKNSVLTRDIIERWEGSGLPQARDF